MVIRLLQPNYIDISNEGMWCWEQTGGTVKHVMLENAKDTARCKLLDSSEVA